MLSVVSFDILVAHVQAVSKPLLFPLVFSVQSVAIDVPIDLHIPVLYDDVLTDAVRSFPFPVLASLISSDFHGYKIRDRSYNDVALKIQGQPFLLANDDS